MTVLRALNRLPSKLGFADFGLARDGCLAAATTVGVAGGGACDRKPAIAQSAAGTVALVVAPESCPSQANANLLIRVSGKTGSSNERSSSPPAHRPIAYPSTANERFAIP